MNSASASHLAEAPQSPAPSRSVEYCHPDAAALPVAVLGVPFDHVTIDQTVARIDAMIASRRPHYVVTANVDFLVQAHRDVELRRILLEADLVLCDGTPVLWASRWLGNALPERVAGSDLAPALIRSAAEKGHRLFLLGGAPGVAAEAEMKLKQQYPKLNVVGTYAPPFSRLLEMDHEEIARQVRAAQPDILLVSFGCPKQEKWIAMHHRALGVPVAIGVGTTLNFLAGRVSALVATIHDLAPFRLPKKYDLLRMFYGRTVVRQLAHRQDHIIAVSRDTANDIGRYFRVPAPRVTVIHNGVDHERFSSAGRAGAAAQLARRHNVRPPFFPYVARLEHPAKNHARLIEAFNRFKEEWPSPWQLVLCGSDWHGAEVIHQLAKRSPFAADIRLPGFVADNDLATWYRATTVTVYPSLFEGFGLPPLEAMACGSPVLASSIGAVGEVCGNAAAKVDPHDVEDLTQQLFRLGSDEALRDQLRASGLAHAQNFDWQRTASATVAIYELAARRTRGVFVVPLFAKAMS